ncbi:MAG: DUF3429 domain-containing protein [Phenylobacterium sp.]
MSARPPIPPLVLAYGLAGLIPFWAPAAAGLVWPELRGAAGLLLAVYAALILSFLGGARFGRAVLGDPPSPVTISLSMLPSITGLATLALPATARPAQLVLLAAALLLHWLWDRRDGGAPPWMARLRTLLTAGAIAGLAAGVAILGG